MTGGKTRTNQNVAIKVNANVASLRKIYRPPTSYWCTKTSTKHRICQRKVSEHGKVEVQVQSQMSTHTGKYTLCKHASLKVCKRIVQDEAKECR